ncbi:L-threonylcarbamoyladenylate synthase [Pseudohongiella spirulinae]|uniref:Threonylcarbamoyl-AMP synthase n=1 Tax=Pseudohongiella spirulinae TaxID=1249552 RepID=A0A0S2K8N8_9GAMM|nr:Sua5/YciO/YrdC/YwlC family protein [Pseudohongiella spirulinae]ALO44714.1 Threonylcarbamoyl-AMP synthase [Pseudohongiella spirulinae]
MRINELAVSQAASVVHSGGIIAYPTEAVWGLGCDPDNEQACFDLLQIKQRPVEKGMILVAASTDQLDFLLKMLSTSEQQQLARAWQHQAESGPVTFLVPDLASQVPLWIKGQHPAVAVRVSSHPLVKALCERVGGPVVSTSANLAGRPAVRTRVQLEKQLGHKLDFILPGSLGGAAKPSKIIDLASGRVMRAD